MANNNVLNLRFNGTILTRADGGVGEVEWISGSENYTVSVDVNKDLYSYFHIILSDKNNERALEIYACKISGTKYTTNFKIPRILKSGERIHIGIIAKKNDSNDVIVSNAFPVKINSGIAQPSVSAIDSNDVHNSGFAAMLNLFNGAKVFKNATIKSLTKNGVAGNYLYLTYSTNDGKTQEMEVGKVSTDLAGLGIQISRKNSQGGGAKLGATSSLIGTQEGGAIGYGAIAGKGFAGGKLAETDEGVAIGAAASAKPVVDGKSKDAIAIGRYAEVDVNSAYATVIGGYAKAINSERSVAIGGGTDVNAGAILEKSPHSIAVGYKSKGENLSGGIVVGATARAIGTQNKNNGTKQANMAIGDNAIAALGGSIAIGTKARCGVVESNGEINIPKGNDTDDATGINSKGDYKAFSSIAIGYGANARRSHSVAIGRSADTHRWGTVAIGFDAIAGSTNDEAKLDENATFDTETNKNKAKTTSGYAAISIGAYSRAKGSGAIAIGNSANALNYTSVAIGSGAKSKASGAIQLGNGENIVAESLQFREKMIVKDGKLQVDLKTDDITGTLPVSKGGTGAGKGHDALKNLGIQRGTLEIKIESKNRNSSGNVYANFSHTFEIAYKDGTRPTVVATLHDTENKGTAISDRFGINIVSTTNKKFGGNIQVGPNHKGEPYNPTNGSNTVHLDWIAIGTPNT